jgi:integrase
LSSYSEDERRAQKLLDKKLGELREGTHKEPKVYKTMFEEMAKDIVNDYKVNGRKSADKVDRCLSHLRESFGLARMMDITTDRIKAYIVSRQDGKAANATVNRELAILKRMFSLGLQTGKVATRPYIPMLKENNVRKGFFGWEDFLKLRKALPDHLHPLVTFAYYTGWRKSEILGLAWRQVDLTSGCVRLDVGVTKGGEGRVVYLTSEMRELLADLYKKRRLDCPWVFHRNGKPIRDFRSAWEEACKATGLTGMLFHDFRRTAIRNMIRAGVPERVAMQISGHRTRSVFDRYHIVSESDLKEAAQRVEQLAKGQAQEPGQVVALKVERKEREAK